MPKKIDQYRVFIATPGGLGDERNSFRKTLEDYTSSDAEPRGITMVGTEEEWNLAEELFKTLKMRNIAVSLRRSMSPDCGTQARN
jgi:hypothetical protein